MWLTVRLHWMFVFAFVLFSLPFLVFAQTPAGMREATPADVGWMTAAGLPHPGSGLVNPNDPNVGQAVGATKQWLQQHATRSANISCLNPQFAEKLKRFMEAVPGGPPIITDAYRDPGKQNALVASGASRAGPCQSYHNYGLAADFNSSGSKIPWMRDNSRNFGINTIGTWDPNHFQDAAGRYGQCGACSGGQGGNGFLPDMPGAGRTPAPSSSLADQIRQALGMQPPPPPPPPPQQTTQPQPLPTQQTPVSSYITTNPISGSIDVASTTPTAPATTTFEQIDKIANPVSEAIDIGTVVPIDLNASTSKDISSLQGTRVPGNTSGTVVSVPSYMPPQTFTSEDLANNPGPYAQPVSFNAKLLMLLKNVLLAASNYLKPFGGNIPGRPVNGVQLE